ncbi:unnamed protein product [Ilex paraguariensis]|uniref:Uncharacterized protein n=1 Tax=Ilex paraguariensis TaxID=185542 RepID=A0ABC8TNJ2_9AQUA
MNGQCGVGSEDDTFWTVCPYCYYVFEYEKMYEECCLRCQNDKCSRGFDAVAIPSPPPREVVEKGQYCCFGFFPFGPEDKGSFPWMPFSPLVPQVEEKKKNDANKKGNAWDRDCFIEISDDSDDMSDEIVSKTGESFDNLSGGKEKTEEATNGGESSNGCERRVQTEVPKSGKVTMKRKKSVLKNTKKLMGRGIRVKRDETVLQTVEELDLKVEASGDGDDSAGIGVENGADDFFMDEMEFFEGADDIYVRMLEISDEGNGKFGAS